MAGAILRILKSYTNGVRPTGKSYGEPYVNFTENQFGVIDSTGAARDLIGVPIYSTTANYAAGVSASYGGRLYVSSQAVNAENPFNAAHWNLVPTVNSPAFTGTPTTPTAAPGTNNTQIASTAFVAAATGNFVSKLGDTMTGNLTLTANLASTYAALTIDCSGSATGADIIYSRNGTSRWVVQGANTSLSDAYSIFHLDNSGNVLGIPFSIGRQQPSIMTLGELIGGPTGTYAAGFAINMMVGNAAGAPGQAGFGIRQQTAGQSVYFAGFHNYASASQVGSITFTDTTTQYATSSDARLKQDEQPFTGGREIIDQINIKDFEWTEAKERAIGVIAQDVHEVYPPAIVPGIGDPGDENFKPWGVDYSKYVPLLIQALQEAHERIDELAAEITELKSSIK